MSFALVCLTERVIQCRTQSEIGLATGIGKARPHFNQLSRAPRELWFAANDDYLFGPFLLAMNTSWRGNLPNKSGRCPKLAASTSAGLPAIHCDRSID